MSIRFLWNYSLNQELIFSNVGSNEYAYLAFERSIKEENRGVLNCTAIPVKRNEEPESKYRNYREYHRDTLFVIEEIIP